MAKSFRYDRATIQSIESGDGFLRGRVTLARPGVFPYLTPDGRIRLEAKLPEHLYSDETIASAQGAPVTEDHPPEGLVHSDNYSNLVKGSVSNVRVDDQGSFLIGLDTIYDADLKKKILSGEKVEVSIGFEQDLDETPGEFNGQRYDAVQKNIRINHLAHVSEGRAGDSVRFHLDSGMDFAVQQDHSESEATGDNTMKTKTFRTDDGKDIQVPEDIHPVLMTMQNEIKKLRGDSESEDLQAKIKELEEKLAAMTAEETKSDAEKPAEEEKPEDAMKKKIDELTAKIDALKAQNDALKKDVSTDSIDKVVQSRLELIRKAEPLLDERLDSLSPREIKLKVISRYLPFDQSIKTDSIDGLIIDARFDAAVELANLKAQQSFTTRTRGDAPAGIESRQNLFMNGESK